MQARLYPAAAALAATACVAAPALGDVPAKVAPPAKSASVRLNVQPGQTARWKSPNLGTVETLRLYIGGRPAAYAVESRTNSCVAYGYEAGVAVRLTDCVRGRRVPYVRVRAVSAALRPVKVALHLTGR
jgi:hypothetical protein